MAKNIICIFSLVLLVAYCQGEAPLERNRAPYPAAGLRPSKPFNLPTTYLPSTKQQAYYQGLEPQVFEISQQRVDYLGSGVVSLPNRQPNKNYETPYPLYQQYPQQPNFVNIQRPSDFYKETPYNGQGKVSTAINVNAVDELDKKETLQILKAALQYYRNINYNNNNDNDNDNTNKNKNSNLQENNDAGKITEGKYYVLTPDNAIQQVSYFTTQDDMEAKTSDFKAQLKYTKIGELNDPLYKYNENGQLVRLVK